MRYYVPGPTKLFYHVLIQRKFTSNEGVAQHATPFVGPLRVQLVGRYGIPGSAAPPLTLGFVVKPLRGCMHEFASLE